MANVKERERIQWIDCAKFLAIFAVMVDHTNGILYSNPTSHTDHIFLFRCLF